MMRKANAGWVYFTMCTALCAIAAWRVHGETWTNVAGHAIEAQLTALEGDVVTLRQTDGWSIRLPLASLAESEQERARRLMGREEIPALVRADFNQCQRMLMRLEQLRRNGAIPDEECARRREAALESLRKACLREDLNEEQSAAVLRQAGENRS